jgi:DNA primase
MRFTDGFIDELKARLRPSEVIGKRVPLKKQGREWAGLSPFAKEKSPSFFVNDDKGFYHCFSSGKHGDIISFLQDTERLSFAEAVEKLAAEAGMPIPRMDAAAEAKVQAQTGLREALEAAAKFFEASLARGVGSEARGYLERRQIPLDVQQQFRLGYAPEARTALRDELVQRGFTQKTLVDAGLIVKTEDGAIIDRFRNRLMFPITDARGRIIAFGGRALDANARAKYLNSPETPLFHKGATLYNLPTARAIQAKTNGPLYVVEGYMDVIACQRAGLAAVAPLGTAMTEEQLAMAWRVVDEPVLCFDGDGAGQRAAGRAAERALPILSPGKSLQVVILPDGQDPDDVLRTQGVDSLRALLAAPTPLVDLVFAHARDAGPLDTPERQAGFRKRLRDIAHTIKDGDVREAYTQALDARRMALFPDVMPQRRGKFDKNSKTFVPVRHSTLHKHTHTVGRLPAQVLLTLIARPVLLPPVVESLSAAPMPDDLTAQVRDALVSAALMMSETDGADLDKDALMGHLRQMGKEGLVETLGHLALLPLDAANSQHPLHEAHTMMAEALARIAHTTPLHVPPVAGARKMAAQGMAALASARAEGAARRALSASDPE